jgi:hypothetical protein
MAFKINDEEWNALHDEPPILFKAYCSIRRCMDYRTKIAGIETRINENYFREVMSYSARFGRKSGEPVTRAKIRWWIESLEKLGLIKHLGNHVFECLLADSEESNQKRYNQGTTMTTTKGTTIKNTMVPAENKDISDKEKPEVGASYPSRHNPPQESGINNHTTYDLSNCSQFDSCPHQKIIALYHEILPMCPRVAKWTPSRAQHLRARWREHPSIELWQQFFDIVKNSKFLTGRITNRDGRSFLASLDWLIKSENFTKTLEGRYD